MVTTINSLPLELIRHVLASVYPLPPYDADNHEEIEDRYCVYGSTALVCSAWRSTSQELMWERVELHSDDAVASFAEVPRLPSKSVIISRPRGNSSGYGEELCEPLQRTLDSARGVEYLSVSDGGMKISGDPPAQFKLDFISGEGFKDLKHLHLEHMQLALDDPYLVLPFRLEHLSVVLNRTPPTTSPSRPFALLCQPSLKTFRLECYPENDSILHDLLPFASHLHTLKLHSYGDREPFVPTFLRACSALQHLEHRHLRWEWLEALPTPLVSLSLENFTTEDAEVLVELIKDGVVGVSKLQQLKAEMEDSDGNDCTLAQGENDPEEGPVWRKFANMCDEKGIEIVEPVFY